ncbi:hypothetical protein QQS21_004101 [Conoideocrella luteorostrata]|uniref:Uncharacterized protein n=1 Tax=Conoideocrella luteorostrata TaxID=1105319 RepID=A0AAJ0CV26_9HYPO|nr:hypothetical protein QQS21_004101 [Conoideocrella luteorostrata]
MWDYKNMSANIAGASYRDESWEDMIIHHGIVTVSEEWAARQGLSVSAATPDSLGDMVYQLDGFHSMHCLYIVREHVLGAINGNHTHHIHHCLDYIRKTLMCNMDVTLSALDEKDLFNAESNYGVHECRDYEAITKWAKANEWKELPEWLATHD